MFQRPRPDGTLGNYYLEYTVNGARKTVSLGTPVLTDAEAERERILAPLRATTPEAVARHIATARDMALERRILAVLAD